LISNYRSTSQHSQHIFGSWIDESDELHEINSIWINILADIWSFSLLIFCQYLATTLYCFHTRWMRDAPHMEPIISVETLECIRIQTKLGMLFLLQNHPLFLLYLSPIFL